MIHTLWRCFTMRCRDEVDDLRAEVHRLEQENMRLSEQAIEDQARLIDLTEQLDTAQYMRSIVGQCRDDADARANVRLMRAR